MQKNTDRNGLSTHIKDARVRKYRKAKEYWFEYQSELKISYPHYSAVEAGTKFPDINLTVAIAKTLKADLRLFCHTWARDQMPTAESKAFFEPVPGKEAQGIPLTFSIPLDDFYVFTEKQILALKTISATWEVLCYINALTEFTPQNEKQISLALGYSIDEVNKAVNWLRNEGLVFYEHGKLITHRHYFHLPNTEEFSEIRNINYFNISKKIIKSLEFNLIKKKEAYRTTFLRRLTRLQAQEFTKHMDDVVGHLGNIDNTGSEFYGLAVAFGPLIKPKNSKIVKNET